jgi:NitT/TauT family transport system permease protein
MKQLWSISMKLLNSNIVRPLILVVGLLVGWELAIKIFAIKPYLIPEPLAVIQQMINEWPTLAGNTGDDLRGIGWIRSALCSATYRHVDCLFQIGRATSIRCGLQSVPKIAAAPLLVVWFGFGIFRRSSRRSCSASFRSSSLP